MQPPALMLAVIRSPKWAIRIVCVRCVRPLVTFWITVFCFCSICSQRKNRTARIITKTTSVETWEYAPYGLRQLSARSMWRTTCDLLCVHCSIRMTQWCTLHCKRKHPTGRAEEAQREDWRSPGATSQSPRSIVMRVWLQTRLQVQKQQVYFPVRPK